MELHRLSCFFNSQAGLPSSDAPSGEMRRHCGSVNSVLLGQVGHRRTCQVVANESIDLGGREKGLKILNPPDHGTARVLDRGGLSALRHPVDAPLPAGDKGVQPWGKIGERTTQGPSLWAQRSTLGPDPFLALTLVSRHLALVRNGDG